MCKKSKFKKKNQLIHSIHLKKFKSKINNKKNKVIKKCQHS